MTDEPFDSFEEFWPYYLSEHSDPTNRTLHALGTLGAVAVAGAAVASRKWKVAALAPVVGYGAAWVGHFFIEKNRPATFDYPLWSLMGDFKMASKMLSGRLDEDLRRYGIEDEPRLLP